MGTETRYGVKLVTVLGLLAVRITSFGVLVGLGGSRAMTAALVYLAAASCIRWLKTIQEADKAIEKAREDEAWEAYKKD